MKKLATGLLAGTASLALGMTVLPAAMAAPSDGSRDGRDAVRKTDNRPGPLTRKQTEQRKKALAMLQNGDAKLTTRSGGGATVKLEPKAEKTALGKQKAKKPTYVEFPVNRTDKVWSLLSEFSDVRHNEIPKPDRKQNNSTYWVPDFNKAHFDNLFMGDGESFKNYYKAQSSGRYDVSLVTEDWVGVPGTQKSYGGNDVEEKGGAWKFVTDSANSWYSAQRAAGKSDAQIRDYLSQFDKWDRYDADGDGNFNESDGYVDHFQAIHAGEGEEAGATEDAIWSHRWYVNPGDFGTTGPQGALFGGTQIGNTGLWIGDYTVEPENGGLGVFAHEYAHDLGLPDYYDTAGGDNSVSFWSLMSSGSWLGHGKKGNNGIGTTPGNMGPEEKLELGWLDYSTVASGKSATANLGPSQNTYDDPKTEANEADQAVKVDLPDKTTKVDYTKPPEGTHAWWSGRDDGLQNTLTRSVPASDKVDITAKVWHEIEQDYDFLYAEYSTDGGTTWTATGDPISGESDWTDKSWSYSPGGKASMFRFRYATDGGVNEAGAFLDQISITAGGTTVTDGAESGNNGWTPDGWTISTGSDTKVTPQYYLLENRQYVGYDKTLGEGPYNFSNPLTKPDWVEFFKFYPGMIVWYVDKAYANNNTSGTPGHGAVLPVDARPAPMMWPDGTKPTNRRQPFDAAFGLDGVPKTCLHKEVKENTSGKIRSVEACAPTSPAMPTFDDSDPNRYWSAANPWGSTKVAGVGVKATVVKEKGGFLTVKVSNP